MTKKPKYLGLREYARHRGVDTRAVRAAVESGRITPIRRGGQNLFDPTINDDQWEENTNHAMNNFLRDEENEPNEPTADKPLSRTASLQAARVKKEEQLANLKELEFQEKMGNVISKKLVESMITKFASAARDSLLGLPSRIAPELAAETDPHAVELKLLEEIRMIMDEFCGARIQY